MSGVEGSERENHDDREAGVDAVELRSTDSRGRLSPHEYFSSQASAVFK
jgi:hypothetical protein